MADALPTLQDLLTGSGLEDRAEQIDAHMVRLQWGSAFVIVGTSGSAIVAIAPLFRNLPPGKEEAFYRKLLEHNAYMGGMASFALQPDGWVVLHAGRPIKGIDPQEFATLVSGVGRFADQFDDKLIAEFFAGDAEAAGATIAEEPAAPADR
ncbi:MAG TPA: YbjN domain-containing protein [Kofleriaceae bacterium]|nr:YbjN domain-containing protein [Kofleriaceae bacterium]